MRENRCKWLGALVMSATTLMAAMAGSTEALLVSTGVPTLGGAYLEITDLNDAGHAAGFSTNGAGDSHAFLWDGEETIDLGTLGGSSPEFSAAVAINNLDQVVGWSKTLAGEYHAFLWEDGTMTDLGLLGGPDSDLLTYVSLLLNDIGQVAGYAFMGSTSGTPQSFLWDDGTLTPITDTRFEYLYATALNNVGQVAGEGGRATTHALRAWIWDNGTLTEIGVLGNDTESHAFAINDGGQVAGYSAPGGSNSSNTAFVWEAGQFTTLPDVGPEASAMPLAMNNAGQIVGRISASPGSYGIAALWEEGDVIDLSSGLQNVDSAAIDINEIGQIVVRTQGDVIGEGVARIFLWENGARTFVADSSFYTDFSLQGGCVVRSQFPPCIVAHRINALGQIASLDVIYHTATPAEQVSEIQERVASLVDDGTLTAGQGNALNTRLSSALARHEDGQTPQACRLLDAFVHQVNALERSGRIDVGSADDLTDAVEALQAEIGC